ncbi:epoxide hydrolase [Achlya hypogyna]|uniref:Epoxide hydrolase n=1 Tax=Achlya hypogyna TaxID=1202772 RepID=A0A1V9YNH5_ACHHY|nr:epoxide hydrolase [Achlya hypogyna]
MARPADPTHRHAFAQLNGVRLHYVDVGPRDGTPVVLLHGWPDLWWGWRHQISALRDTYRVIVPDQRGFGATSSPDSYEQYRKKIVAQDYVCLLGNHLKIGKAVFLGHDWGGAVAWAMATFHPDRVLAVGAVCTPYFPPPRAYVPLEMIATLKPSFSYQLLLADEATGPVFDTHVAKVLQLIYGATPQNAHSTDLRSLLESIDTLEIAGNALLSDDDLQFYVNEYARQGFQKGLHWYRTTELDWVDAQGASRVIPHDALFISAGKDPVLLPEFSRGMEKWVPRLTRGHIPDGTHWVLWEQPNAVNAIILEWLRQLPCHDRAKL